MLLGIENICNLLVSINAASNFVLYTALCDKYRNSFLAVFTICCRMGVGESDASIQ